VASDTAYYSLETFLFILKKKKEREKKKKVGSIKNNLLLKRG